MSSVMGLWGAGKGMGGWFGAILINEAHWVWC